MRQKPQFKETLAIPWVNIIMLFLWAFGSSSARRNFARAQLIVFVLSIGLAILLYILEASSGLVGVS